MVSATEENRVIRDPAFAKRLEQACDNSPHCPPKHSGRLTWIVDQFEKRFHERVTVQSCARWFNGEARPRQNKVDKLAQMLGVDAVWLFIGVEQQPVRARRNSKSVEAVIDSASALLEVHEAMGKGDSHAARKLRDAIAEYRAAA